MLAQVCERLPGADADVVTTAIGCDSRIGQKYLKGALGYGGPCFPRDNIAFSALARATGAPALLAEATDQLNRRQVPRLAEIILARLPKGGTVGILGLSYKPHTEVIDESQGVDLAKHLLNAGVRVTLYDPAAMENSRRQAPSAGYAASAAECAGQADVLAITTAWPEFKNLKPADLKQGGQRPTVIDCWRVLPADLFSNVSDYLRLGYGGAGVGAGGRASAAGSGSDDSSSNGRAASLFSASTD
jgi:UDPglucose 6-dehydrogenase